jgi:hypothetical protein
LIDNDGQYHSIQSIQNIRQLNIKFPAIRGTFVRSLTNIRVKLEIFTAQLNTLKPIIPKQIQEITQNIKGCHPIYEILFIVHQY